MARAVIRNKPKKEPVEQDPEKWVSHNFEFKHQFLVGVKMMEGGEPVEGVPTWEEVQEEIKALLRKRFPKGSFTPSGGYLIIHEGNGRVQACYPHDFDYATMDRKPGTHPPLYTLTQDEQKEVRELQRQVELRAHHESSRVLVTGNSLARNPTNLLTTHETDALQRIKRKRVPARSSQVETSGPVEWSEEDADNETLVEQETEKLLQRSDISTKKVAKQVRPVRVKRK